MRCLSSGSSSARASMPSDAADGFGRAAVVAGQHDRADAHRRQRLHAGRRVRPRLVAHGDQPGHDAIGHQHRHGLALGRCRPSMRQSLRLGQRQRARRRRRRSRGTPPTPPTLPATPLPPRSPWPRRRRDRCLVGLGAGQDGRGERMAGAGFQRGRQRAARRASARPKATMSVTAGLPCGQRAGLVEGDGRDPAERLPAPRRPSSAGRAARRPTAPRRWRPASR